MFLVIFQVGQGIAEINPQDFLVSTWERGHFLVFFHFSKLWITEFPKLLIGRKSLFLITRSTTKQIRQVLLDYVETNGRGNDLKIASFLVFFKMSLCKIRSAFVASSVKFKF